VLTLHAGGDGSQIVLHSRVTVNRGRGVRGEALWYGRTEPVSGMPKRHNPPGDPTANKATSKRT
jgi:hypothetical protein